MKLFSNKLNLLKSGVAVAMIGLSVAAYSHSGKFSPKIIDAKAEVNPDPNNTCVSNASTTCTFTSSDGVSHTTTNAKNG